MEKIGDDLRMLKSVGVIYDGIWRTWHPVGILYIQDPSSPVLALLVQPQSLNNCPLVSLTRGISLFRAGGPVASNFVPMDSWVCSGLLAPLKLPPQEAIKTENMTPKTILP